MYWGSVKFFKHLIITVVLLAVVIPVIICVVQLIKLKDKEIEIESLISEKNAAQLLLDLKNGNADLSAYSAEDFLNLLNSFGIDDRQLLELLMKHDADAFNEIWSKYSDPVSVIATTDDKTAPFNTDEITDDDTNTNNTNDNDSDDINNTGNDENAEDTESDNNVNTGEVNTDGVLTSQNPYETLYPDLYVETNSNVQYVDDENYIYLTFDDGPSIYTHSVLHYLEKYNLNATFFVIPDESENCKNYLNTMLKRGDTVGIHTLSHDYDTIYTSVEDYLEDFYAAFKMVEEQTGYRPYLFRFPGGSMNSYNAAIRDDLIKEMERRGFIYFDWNVDSEDAMGANWTQMYNKVLKETAEVSRAVILFHDGPGREKTVLVLEDIINALMTDPRCFTFSAITEKTKPLHF